MDRRGLIFVLLLFWTSVSNGQILDLNSPDVLEPLPLPTPLKDLHSPAQPTPTIAEADQSPDDPRAATTITTAQVREIQGTAVERGPIHEAFAEPVQMSLKPPLAIQKAPPEAVNELAPEAKPTEANTVWIPGYWSWDQQRKDYVWVSGVWRKVPKGRTWLTGRWEETDDGFQRVQGFWAKTDASGQIVQQDVVPTPPRSLEEGPNREAPSEDHFWIPGNWNLDAQQQYAWRPGFWSNSYDNWVWVPDHYSWTPNGCMFVAGYWDYPWEQRGTLYAPCTFAQADLRATNVCYRPSQVIDSSLWLANLWVGPSNRNYYYGNYYDFTGLGYSPWYSYYGQRPRNYDPFYSYYSRRFPVTYGIGLYGYLDGLHSHYRRNASYRPSISLYAYDDWFRRSQGRYRSMYGDVHDLYRRHGGNSIHRGPSGIRGQGNNRGVVRVDPGRRGGDIYRSRSTDDYLYRRATDRYRDIDRRSYGGGNDRRSSGSSSANSRRLLGYANGQAIYSGDRTGGVKRGEMGVPRTNSSSSRNANSSRRANDAMNELRRSLSQQQDRSRRDQQVRQQLERSRRDQQVRQQQDRQRQQDRVRREQQQRSYSSRSNRATQPRARTQPRASQPTRTNNPTRVRTAKPQSSPPARTVTRSRPEQSRPQPQARSKPKSSSSSKYGFSTSSMKKARGADLQRQRAALQKRMSERKGKK